MIPARDPATTPADARLDEVTRILAEAILRARLREKLKGIPAGGTTEIDLEVSASCSAHGGRNRERR